jgi:RimJ/RimL family protein N-acetyltransferase
MGFEWGERLPRLEAANVVLRGLEERDVPALFQVFSDPEVMRYWSSTPMQTEDEAAAYLRDIQDGLRTRRLFQWGIVVGDDEVIGTCTLYHLEHGHRRGEIGFALGRRHWGQGLASQALTALLEFAFGTLDLNRIEADADPRNERSLGLLERHGFRREGSMRERYRVGGEVQDTVMLGLLRREWTHGQAARSAKDSGLEIRIFQDADADAVIALWRRCGLLRPWNDPRKDIARKRRFQGDLFLVGTVGATLRAAVMAGYDGHRGWINYLAVDPDQRRRGLGRALMAAAERRLAELGCAKINLQIRHDNVDAIAFYERLGYSEDAVRSFGKRLERDDT